MINRSHVHVRVRVVCGHAPWRIFFNGSIWFVLEYILMKSCMLRKIPKTVIFIPN